MIESIFDQAIGELPVFLLVVEASKGRGQAHRLGPGSPVTGEAVGHRREQEEQADGVSRMYGEPIDVTAEDGKPIRFVWRGRLYIVRGELEHWVISREWWQRNDPDTDVPPEREFWRVEASSRADVPRRDDVSRRADAPWSADAPRRADVPRAVYELRRDVSTDDWLLVRVWD
jgi:hypothetical protein